MSRYPFGDDYEVTNGVITKYVTVPSLGVVAKKTGGATFWHHTDRLGSIQAVTDVNQVERLRRTYRLRSEDRRQHWARGISRLHRSKDG